MAQGIGEDEPVDAVITWVDDSFPGYLEDLNRHAADPRDTDPNRTRDNLQILRFALRAVEANLPWLRRVYLFTCRPQVPAWLNRDHPRLRVVHHDEVMDPAHLPTFNSFAIGCYLHRLPGLSERFLYIVDDMLAMSPGLGRALVTPDGRPYVFLDRRVTRPLDRLDPARDSAWNLALAGADRALVARYGGGPRRHIAHAPQLLDRAMMDEMETAFPDEIERTRAARFRAADNVPPEYLVAHVALATGRGAPAPGALERRVQGYVSVENLLPWTWAQIQRQRWRRPLSVTLNDAFQDRPSPAVEALVLRQLTRWFPRPSAFEIAGR